VQAGCRIDAGSVSLVPTLTVFLESATGRTRVCQGIIDRFVKKGTTEWPCPISLSELLLLLERARRI
jgi:hypothetical protein